jgi:transposase
MDEEEIRLSGRERQRLSVLRKVAAGELSVREGADELELSERQVWRLLAAYRKSKAAGLAHGNRGRTPAHALGKEVRNKVIQLARFKCVNCSHQEIQDLLARHEGIRISRSTVRNILAAAGIHNRKRGRVRKQSETDNFT